MIFHKKGNRKKLSYWPDLDNHVRHFDLGPLVHALDAGHLAGAHDRAGLELGAVGFGGRVQYHQHVGFQDGPAPSPLLGNTRSGH